MSTDTLEFPTIDADAPAPSSVPAIAALQPDLAKVDLQAVALAHFAPAHAAIAAAKEKLTDVVHDLSTTTKLADAKTLRNRLLKVPLAEARATSTALKSRLTKVSKAVGEELEAIEEGFEAADKLITPQIKAREDQLAEEARIAAEKEQARVDAHKVNLAKLAEPSERCRQPGMTAERIANGIKAVQAITLDPASWEEFYDRAVEQRAVTLERMGDLHGELIAAEAEARRLEEERIENERKAAELKKKEDELAAAAAALAAQQAEFAAQQEAAAKAQRDREEAARAEGEAKAKKNREDSAFEAWLTSASPSGDVESVQRQWEASPEYHELHGIEYRAPVAAEPNFEAQDSQQVLKAEPATADATDRDAPVITSPSVGSMGAGQAADAAPVVGIARGGYIPFGARAVASAPAAEVPMLKLGELWTELGFDDREAFLASIGFAATPAPKGTGKLYRESDLNPIRLAIAKRMTEAATEASAEAQKAA